MRRFLAALGLAAALAWPAGGAMACTDGSYEDHVLLLRLPTILPRAAVVLEVDLEMDEEAARRLSGAGRLVVDVRRTVRGDLDERRVAITYDFPSSCDYLGPPGLGRFVVGLVERGADGRPVRDSGGRVIVRTIRYRQHESRTPEEERRIASEYDEPPPAEALPDEDGVLPRGTLALRRKMSAGSTWPPEQG